MLTHLQQTLKANLDVGKFCILYNEKYKTYMAISPYKKADNEYLCSKYSYPKIKEAVEYINESSISNFLTVERYKWQWHGTYNPPYKRLEPGQKVKVREDAREIMSGLHMGEWDEHVEKFVGKVGEIKYIDGSDYEVWNSDKTNAWTFPLEALELVVDEPEEEVKEVTLAEVAAMLGVSKVKIVE